MITYNTCIPPILGGFPWSKAHNLLTCDQPDPKDNFSPIKKYEILTHFDATPPLRKIYHKRMNSCAEVKILNKYDVMFLVGFMTQCPLKSRKKFDEFVKCSRQDVGKNERYSQRKLANLKQLILQKVSTILGKHISQLTPHFSLKNIMRASTQNIH